MEHANRIHRGKPEPLQCLIYKITGLEEAEAKLVIEMGGAYIGKHRCKDPIREVRSGEQVSAWWCDPPQWESVHFEPSSIIEETRHWLVVDKPSGMPTQGRRDADYMCLYELLKQNVKGYVGLHHRLDQDTSGLMLFSRDRAINKAMAALFEQRLVKKHYLALCTGSWPDDKPEITVDAPIAPLRQATGTRQQITASGKKAVTHLKRLAQIDDQVLLEAQPLTGRTHQIRVHCAHLGMPLLGDTLYGGTGDGPFLLHCYRLQWPEQGPLAAGNYEIGPPPEWEPRLGQGIKEAYGQWRRNLTC